MSPQYYSPPAQLRACGTDLARLAALRLLCNTAFFDALQALSLLLVFSHDPQREAAAVMLYSRIVAPDTFPAVLGACFADASKLRLQQVHTHSPISLFTFCFFSVHFHAQSSG